MTSLSLPERVDITYCEALLDSLRNYYAQNDRLVIDAACVSYITTPALQILASLFLTARSDAKPCTLSNATSALRSACEQLGLTDELQQWETANV